MPEHTASTPLLPPDLVRRLQREFGTPLFVYVEERLHQAAAEALAFPNAYGLTVRYAMKACPTAAIVQTHAAQGLHIDASSGYEAERAMRAGVPAERIQITAQEPPRDLGALLDRGCLFNACSIAQLRAYGALRPGSDVCVRMNPGLGSGHSNRTNVGGPSSSFGIWHEHIDEVLRVAAEYGLRISGMHTHIGSGADPAVWNRCARMTLALAERLPEVRTLSLGGGFRVGRMPDESSADLQAIGALVRADFVEFAERTGRRLHLEIEPGAYLVARAGFIIATVTDVVDTGAKGRTFIKTDTGMTEVTRPSLYGAQHPIEIIPADGAPRPTRPSLVVGHCCESGDILTPEPGNPEGLGPRMLPEAALGDAVVVGGAGAYCSGMSTKNYNSFPEAAEVLVRVSGEVTLIRKRQTLDQIVQNEALL